MSDPFKAALDAAAVALVAEGVEAILPGRREEWLKQPPTTEARHQAAIAIAAFLRALPEGYLDCPVQGADGQWSVWQLGWHSEHARRVASAVQRAGGGDA